MRHVALHYVAMKKKKETNSDSPPLLGPFWCLINRKGPRLKKKKVGSLMSETPTVD